MLRIGTDCSGIEAPIEALKQLNIPFQHKWSCEIDKFARQSILANYEPEILYEDITKRDHSELPDVDIYVCGFPCQSFSLMGKKLGTQDSRSNIMLHCIEVIKKKRPPVFILENVKNFKFIEKGKPYKFLIDSLTNIAEDGEQVYNIYPDIYNTKDYGIPQNRQRIYFIGIHKAIQLNDFQKPNVLPLTPLENFIIDTTILPNSKTTKNIIKKLTSIQHKHGYIFPNSNYVTPLEGLCPTLSTRCDMFFHSTYNRYLTIRECLLLQGFKCTFNQVVSNSQMFKQIGNSMSVNVIKSILKSIVDSTTFQYFVNMLMNYL